jgi:hypothetical protein
MILQPGVRFVVAPYFHLQADWPLRLLVGAGVEESDRGFIPLNCWRPPSAHELSLLTRVSNGPTSVEDLDTSVCLFQLPEHLCSAWWKLLDQTSEMRGNGRLPGFDTFVRQIVDYMVFKRLPVPEGASCDVIVGSSGQNFGTWELHAGHTAGLRCDMAAAAPWPGDDGFQGRRLWAGINLGDEETSIVIINLFCRQLQAELHRQLPEQPSPATVGELVRQFLRACSDYPTVRLILKPGEGYRIPRGGLILDSYPKDKKEPDVMLTISARTPQPDQHQGLPSRQARSDFDHQSLRSGADDDGD